MNFYDNHSFGRSRWWTAILLFGVLVTVAIETPRLLKAADCNVNGVEDATDVADGTSADCNANLIPDECEFEPPQFSIKESGFVPTPRPVWSVHRDFNADGLDDVAVLSQEPTSKASIITVHSSRGDGEFDAAIPLDAGTDATSIAAGDFNGDGRSDLATANSTLLLVFLNRGDRTWDPPLEVAVPAFTRVVAAGDVSGDGASDLLAANGVDDKVFVILANVETGAGVTFADAVEHLVGERPTAVRAEDLDGDGHGDLVVANRDTNDLSILRNQGDGTFVSVGSIDAGGSGPSEVHTADFDDDGDADLLVTVRRALSIFFNEGNFQFTEPLVHNVNPRSTTPSDVDGDGDVDIVVSVGGGRSISTLVNVGGSFIPAEEINVTVFWALPGDFDGDGDDDIALANIDPPRVAILWNREPGGLRVSSSLAPLGGQAHSVTAVDIDSDGLLDVATANGPDLSFSILRNDGSGVLGAPLVRHVHTSGHLMTVVGADLNEDGRQDIIVGNRAAHKIAVNLNLDDGTNFAPPVDYGTGEAPWVSRAADFHGDGHVDVLLIATGDSVVVLHPGFGDGTLGQRQTFPVGTNPWGLAIGDLDGDGDIDAVTANRTSSDASLLWNQGDGSFAPAESVSLHGSPLWVEIADLDQNGWLDVVVANNQSRSVTSLLNQGGGVLIDGGTFDAGTAPFSVAVGDIDGDGTLDVLAAGQEDANNTVSFLPGKGDGTFPIVLTQLTGGSRTRFSLPIDLDANGSLDVVVVNRGSSDANIFLNKSAPGVAAEDFLSALCTELDFVDMTTATSRGIVDRAGKYITPARPADGRLLETTYQNVRRFALHQEFLAAVFPDRFPSLGAEAYAALTARRATREYYAGVINRLRLPGSESESGGIAYGFTVVVDGSDSTELLRQEEVGAVYAELRQTFTLEPLGYFPDTPAARDRASEWSGAEFEIFFDTTSGPVDFEAYTQGVGFGRLRVLTEEELSAASETGEISFQNILVLEIAPRDIEGVFSGVVTGQRQVELSHLAIRTARRGTPNAYVSGALEEFREWDGQLVRLEVTAGGYTIRAASQEEAEEHWRTSRPSLEVAPTLDSEFSELLTLGEIAELESSGLSGVPRFGGKATNLSRLQEILTGEYAEYQEKGFAIPMRYYVEFMRENRLESFLDRSREVTYEEYVQELLVDESFQTDSRVRFEALDMLRDHMRDEGVVRAEVIALVAARVREVMGTSETTRVRFRSSSNVEDDLQFNGAGLYNSTSGCLADEFDGDEEGPSQCDSEETNERTITRALKRVWRSLWNFRAYEEREFFGIDQEIAAMGILVNRTFIGEASQGVAFTGNTSNILDRRYVVTAQLGEESVVSPEPGVLAETNVLELVEGEVVEVIRAVRSTLVGEGEVVVSEAQLGELGRLMWHMDENFPLDLGRFDRSQVLLDVEYKFMSDGELAVKQVRPFLLSEPPPPTPEFTLEVPEGFELCGVFQEAGVNRGPRQEYELKSNVKLRSGTIPLTTTRDSFTAELFDEVRFGPERQVATPLESGRFRLRRIPNGELTKYRFTFAQRWGLDDGTVLEIELLAPLEFEARGEEPISGVRVLSDAEFTTQASLEPLKARVNGQRLVNYGSCRHQLLPLWRIDVTLADGGTLTLNERFSDDEARFFGTNPASLQRATVSLPGGHEETIRDYWRLVYSASRHNLAVHYWIVLAEPVAVDGTGGLVRAIEFAEPTSTSVATARYLGVDLEPLKTLDVTSFDRRETEAEPTPFRRGDVDASGQLDLSDALAALNYIFGRAVAPSCVKSADANDDGKLNVTDGVTILLHLFAGRGDLAAPFTGCGADTTPDLLSCFAHSPCDSP